MNLSNVRKALVALATFLTVVTSSALLPAKYQPVADSILTGLGAFGVYAAKNDDYPVEK